MIDRLQRFPNQIIEGRPQECTAEYVGNALGNFFNVAIDAGFTYGATHDIQKTEPTFAGADPIAAMLSALRDGVLPLQYAPFNALTTSQTYEADFSHYSAQVRAWARERRMNCVKPLRSYKAITDYLDGYQIAPMLTITWYESFMTPNPDGTLPAPSGAVTTHCVAVYGYDRRGLQLKPWLGPEYGAGGYCYLSPELLPEVFTVAAGFVPTSWRWMGLVLTALNYPTYISTLLPEMRATA